MARDVLSHADIMKSPEYPQRTGFGSFPIVDHVEVPGEWSPERPRELHDPS